MKSPTRFISVVGRLFVVTALLLQMSGAAFAQVETRSPSYLPGDIVTIYGDNSDNAGYLPGEPVQVTASGPSGDLAPCETVADDNGAWSCDVTIPPGDTAAGILYTYTATGLTSKVAQSGTFTGAYADPTATVDPTATPEPPAPTDVPTAVPTARPD